MDNARVQQCARWFGGGEGHFNEDLHKMADRVGVPVGQLVERLGRMFAMAPEAVMANLDGLAEVLGVLTQPGVEARVYLPGSSGVSLSGLLTNNYTDSTGSTGYSANDGVAGLVLDGMGSVGEELVTASTTTGAGWTVSNTDATHTVTFSASGMRVNVDTSTPITTASLLGQLVIGKTYRVTVAATNTTNTLKFDGLNGASTIVLGGTNSYIGVATGPAMAFYRTGAGVTDVTIASVSVREVTGIHATQSTTANKPAVRRGLLNLARKSRTISTWSSTAAGTITTGQADPDGGTAAQLFAGANKNVYLSGIESGAVVAGTPVTHAIQCYSPSAGTVIIGSSNGTAQSLVNVSAGWGVYSFSWTSSLNDGPVLILNGSLTSLTVYQQGFFAGTLTAQQILAEGGIPLTTSAAASNPNAGRYWWGLDGDDSLVLGGQPFEYTDDWFVCIGGSCSNKSSYPGLLELGGTTARVYIYYDASGIVATQLRNDVAADTYIVGPAFADCESGVLSSYKQSGIVCTGLNGVYGTPAAAPAGTYTLTSAKLVNGLVGMCGAAVIVKGALTAAERLTLERWVASLTPNAPSF